MINHYTSVRSLLDQARKHVVAGSVIAVSGKRSFGRELRNLLAPDWFSVILILCVLAFFFPTIARHTDNAMQLVSFFDDDALISMQLDGMTVWPYGNPGTYLDPNNASRVIPAHWHTIRYDNLPYYGGLYLDIALLIWAPLKLLGLPFFPTAPIVLRAIALFFTGCTILAGYNFARVNFGRATAALAILFLSTEYFLFYIGTYAHPDSLLFFLNIVALAICVRHAREGGMDSLVAIGIAAGLAQSAKMGGPILIPITVIAISFGARATLHKRRWLPWLQQLVCRGTVAASVAISVFLLTTPYALLDDYFLRVWRHWATIFTGPSPISSTTWRDWTEQFVGHLGVPLLIIAALSSTLPILRKRDREKALPLVLLATLGLCTFLYYALFQKYWVQLQYLVIAYWVVGLLAAYGMSSAMALPLITERPQLKKSVITVVALAILGVFLLRMQPISFMASQYANWRQAPQFLVGEWATRHLPKGQNLRIISDGPASFDPLYFPGYAFLAAPVRYQDLLNQMPDYFLLTRYRGNWQSEKIRLLEQDPWDPKPFNFRLYQDLLGTDPDRITDKVGAIPFLSKEVSFGPTNWVDQQPTLTSIVQSPNSMRDCESRVFDCFKSFIQEKLQLSAYTDSFAAGRYVALYKLDKDQFVRAIPQEKRLYLASPLASSAAPDAPASSVLKGGGGWRSGKQGYAAVGEYIGFELPRNLPVAVEELVIRWVAWGWCPTSIEIEYSDDGREWQSAGVFPVLEPDDVATKLAGTVRWDESFKLPKVGAHRFWRIKALAMPDGNFFGLEKIEIR